MTGAPLLPALFDTCARALVAAQDLLARQREALAARVGRPADADRLAAGQHCAHGHAWVTTCAAALAELLAWARRLDDAGRLSPLEALILQIGFGEYLAQFAGGLPMSQGEIFRPGALDPDGGAQAAFAADAAVGALRAANEAAAARAHLAALLGQGAAARRHGDPADDDATLALVREQFARYADDRAASAHRWHLDDALVPEATLAELGDLGVFGLTVPAAWGGSGMGKVAMCVVTEELSRAWIALGSLGTRSEIAAELILRDGTPAQRERWLPGIAAGRILPAAAFTEPEAGSDLASLRTRAERVTAPDGRAAWRITGAKTWTTHGARSDVLTLLARTDPAQRDHPGLSMFLLAKPRGTATDPFPVPGMRGSEIPVLGYRGMREYEIAFDGVEVPEDALLGGEPGRGFRQLMQSFESARIQTAARAVGVAQNAFELALRYALGRRQFGRPIAEFPRVAGKLAWMAVETMLARQLTLHAARAKDAGRRCDREAGMAKLLAARVAWANADNAVQIHGGNGYALEYPVSRVLVDARILGIFEGTAEIQANIVARALLDGRG